MSIFERFSLKENGRIMSLMDFERAKGSMRPTDGYLFDMTTFEIIVVSIAFVFWDSYVFHAFPQVIKRASYKIFVL
jgi:hypothetical protein